MSTKMLRISSSAFLISSLFAGVSQYWLQSASSLVACFGSTSKPSMSCRSSSKFLAASENGRSSPPAVRDERGTEGLPSPWLPSLRPRAAGSICRAGRRRRLARWVWSAPGGLFPKMGRRPASPFSWPRARQGDPRRKPYRPASPQWRRPPPAPGHAPRRLRRDRPRCETPSTSMR